MRVTWWFGIILALFLILLNGFFVAAEFSLVKVRDTQLYVSRGTGFWGPPMRVGAPAEITLLTLQST